MKNLKKFALVMLAFSAMTLTSCLHILEDVTFNKDGSGVYKLSLDMSEMKNMMEMFKNMGGAEGDSTGVDGVVADPNADVAVPQSEEAAPTGGNEISQMGEQLVGVKSSLKGVAGITDIVETMDTTNFMFGYSFSFANIEALNKAIRIINKEKYDAKAEETFKYKGKKFERLAAANIGEELKKALAQGGDEDGAEEGSMDMMKSFFADMTYKQVYHFPDRVVKKSSNTISELSDNGHTLTIALKPFDEEQANKKVGVVTEVKLK